MAIFSFTKAILEDKPIDVFNNGKMQRDFTYIDDIVEGVLLVTDRPPAPAAEHIAANGRSSSAPYRLYNIGNHQPVELIKVIEVLEKCLGKAARKNMLPMQPGDVPATFADVDDLTRDTGFRPRTSIELGLKHFTDWYHSHYRSRAANRV
jgi:UDP-glucuronate 4-epimerase